MKILQVHNIDSGYSDFIKISINGKKIFSMGASRSADIILGRDFRDAWKVIDMMKQAYEAGREGEDFIVEKIEI